MNKVPKVFVADPISSRGVEALAEGGVVEVVVKTGLKEDELIQIIPEFAGLVVRSQTKVTPAVFAAAKNLKVVGRAGVGIDNVDVEAATKHGVIVMNAPGGNTISTAEHAFSLMLSVARNIPQANASMKEGRWDRKKFEGVELYDKTLAILGMGRIGTEVARRAIAFGMKVLAYDPYISASKAKSLQVEVVEKIDDILPLADFITVHMPLTDETMHMIGAKQLPLLKKGVRIVNCARGGLIDENVLAEGLRSGQIAGAALDVFEVEPPTADWPHRSIDTLVLTPHLGASTAEAQELVGIEIAEAVRATLLQGEIRNSVNMPNIDAKTLSTLGPWIELGSKLGLFLAQIAPKRAEKLSIRYSGRLVDLDLTAVTRALVTGFLRHIHGEEVNQVNAPAILRNLGLEVVETRQSETTEFTDLIEAIIEMDGVSASVGGTLYGSKPRVVTVNGRFVEGIPSGTLLLLENRDRPGIVGHLGTLLGGNKVNIAGMSLSRNEVGGQALTLLNLDSAPDEALLAKVTSDADISSARVIRL
ncbi:MAG: phosphoglycerate dehydrogenase [Verrucomicrobia bacterium]|jgi:D-3-phosphoglycerate dehydrogenase|nr:MAG: phosphoglycerate dehydrogenase [Verrucomicrobiota bacterium]